VSGIVANLISSPWVTEDQLSWWGVAVAAGCIASLSFRDRLVVRWVGALAVLAVGLPLGFLLAFGFTSFSGVITPVFLVPAGIGMALRRE
jgi:hypothetical protein